MNVAFATSAALRFVSKSVGKPDMPALQLRARLGKARGEQNESGPPESRHLSGHPFLTFSANSGHWQVRTSMPSVRIDMRRCGKRLGRNFNKHGEPVLMIRARKGKDLRRKFTSRRRNLSTAACHFHGLYWN